MVIPKKQLLWIIAGIFGLTIAVVIWMVFRHFAGVYNVYFDLSDDVRYASIYRQGVDGGPTSKEATLYADGFIALEKGDYLAEATGDHVAMDSYIAFTVYPDIQRVDITPSLTKGYLASLLVDPEVTDPRKADSEAIKDIIRNSQGLSADVANITKGELTYDGNWYVGIITTNTEKSRSRFDQYKIILHRDGGEWSVVADQAFVFSYGEHPDIPREVVQFANKYEI
jgi:hypothetical protein